MEFPYLLDTDTYKLGHAFQYPKNLTGAKAYLAPRKNKYDTPIVVWGIRYLYDTVINRKITQEDIEIADTYIAHHGAMGIKLPWPKHIWQRVVDQGGYLPFKIRALPEGTKIYPNTPILEITIEDMDNEFAYLITWLETAMVRLWSAVTIATKSYFIHSKIGYFLSITAGSAEGAENKLVDFGARGVSSQETAAWSGAAHLTSFDSTDNLLAGWLATKYNDGVPVGTSVQATEHSVMTSHPNEIEAFRQALSSVQPGGVISVVADSYNWHQFLQYLLPTISKECAEKNVFFVLRPDSGNPVTNISEGLDALEVAFGSTTSPRGYKVIKGAALLQGDGINEDNISQLLKVATVGGYCVSNLIFGMGGGLLQQANRDTLGFAMKLSAIRINDEWLPIMKSPSTDDSKRSIPGPFWVSKDRLTVQPGINDEDNALELIWDSGPTSYKWLTFSQVRELIKVPFRASRPLSDMHYYIDHCSASITNRYNSLIAEIKNEELTKKLLLDLDARGSKNES